MALDFNPLDFFKEELQSDKAEVKINAINSLHLIASALGPARISNELLPYLQSILETDPYQNEDELLFSLAKQYANLYEYMDQSKAAELIKPLEHLAAQEETVIREQAIESMVAIVEKGPNDLVPQIVVPALHRLATKTDFFTARVSACALFPTVYRKANSDQKSDLRKAYNAICSDDTPMVRRAAANKMASFVTECSLEDLEDMKESYKSLAYEDTQDTIRVASVHTTLQLAKMYTQEVNEAVTFGVIKQHTEDRSWRVRLTVAKKFADLCEAFGPELTERELLRNQIPTLMKDHELEVRRETVKIVETCIIRNLISKQQLETIIVPELQKLATDPAQPVRAALAYILGPVAETLGRDLTTKHLMLMITDLMKDEFHDVRLNMVSHAGTLCEVLGVDGMAWVSLLSTIQALIMDNHWRIRQSVVEQVPKLAKSFGVDMFQSKLEALFLSSLRDSVHSVRSTAILKIREIAETFGAQWTVEHLMPKIVEQYQQNTGYANRVTTLNTLPQMSAVMSQEQISLYLVQFAAKATKDGVPNVRFQACKTLDWLLLNNKLSKKDIDNIVRPALNDLKDDSDSDVQYFSQTALSKC
jgi:serine/threonine-protein phosphatase 2A regulatory subunit A